MSTQLNDKDLHCIARIIQSALFADSLFYGCQYCEYCQKCFFEKNCEDSYFELLRKKLQDITKIDLSIMCDPNNLEEKFKKKLP